MITDFNINREFVRWFYEEQYPQINSNRAQVMKHSGELNTLERDYWMREAFKQGAKILATETTCVLGDWACAVAGLEAETLTPEQVYDRAQENLILYYEQLELFK
jgi:hypothetical protein